MNCVVVHAHPDPESFNQALCQAAVDTLTESGHTVDLIDLYKIDYQPCLTTDEHVGYHNLVHSGPDETVAKHMKLVGAAEVLLFVYPTWWSGMPAILKGWLERTMLPGFAFGLEPDRAGVKVRPRLTNIKHLVGVTTYGSSRLEVRLLGDAGRRTVTRTVRALCGARTKTTWLGMPRLDGATSEQRADFLDTVASELRSCFPDGGAGSAV